MSLWQETGWLTGDRNLNLGFAWIQIPFWLLEDLLGVILPPIFSMLTNFGTWFNELNVAVKVVAFLILPLGFVLFILSNFVVFF